MRKILKAVAAAAYLLILAWLIIDMERLGLAFVILWVLLGIGFPVYRKALT